MFSKYNITKIHLHVMFTKQNKPSVPKFTANIFTASAYYTANLYLTLLLMGYFLPLVLILSTLLLVKTIEKVNFLREKNVVGKIKPMFLT